MGLLDRFKKQKITNVEMPTQPNIENRDNNVIFSTTNDGRLQVDYINKRHKFGQFYDTTRLIVDNYPLIIENREVQNCAVSWYSQDDAILLDPRYNMESANASQYKGVLAEIDVELLRIDPEYCSIVMENLLERNRINKYLEDGLTENPRIPCGKYIGGVGRNNENRYTKFFTAKVGEASHQSPLMVKRRVEHREKMENNRKMIIAEKQAQIQKLQSEIDDINR